MELAYSWEFYTERARVQISLQQHITIEFSSLFYTRLLDLDAYLMVVLHANVLNENISPE